jgi:transcriptional regulator with XRE-family HTH domain
MFPKQRSLCNDQWMTEQQPSGAPTWDVADRMRKGLREANVGVQEMADYLGVARSTLGNWIGGRIEPSTQTLRLWALRCAIDYEWLAYGRTEIHIAAARTGTDPTLNNARCSRSGGLLYRLPARVGPCVMQHAA